MRRLPPILFLPPYNGSPLRLWGMVEIKEGVLEETHCLTFAELTKRIDVLKAAVEEQK